MKNTKSNNDLKQKAVETSEKAKEQIDSILEKKPIDYIKLPLAAKVFAILCIIQCVISAPIAYAYVVDFVTGLKNGSFGQHTISSIIMYSVFLCGMILTIAFMIAIGVNMLLNRRRAAAILATISAITITIATISDIMIVRITPVIYVLLISIILLIALKSYLDPSLSKERKAHKEFRDKMNKEAADNGNLGFNKNDGKPKLNYFNIFWMFFIMCIVGYIWEIIWHMTVDNPGVYEERAGFLFGPFSPIYGFGAVIITLILYKFTNKNIVIIFIISALLGGFFEYFVSVYLEACFGVRSWDYSHLPFNIEGRTSLRFFIIWGIIGVIWIKLLMKPLFKLINKIPWKLRYSLTIIATAFMLINMVMTFEALDCWYSRNAGHEPQTPMEQFYADYFDDEFMHNRFENMKMNPEASIWGSGPKD